MWYGYHPGYDGAWSWFMGLHGLVWLLFLGVVIAAGVALVRYLWRSAAGRPHERATGGRDSALHIIEMRYARGEIDRDEFLARKKDLAA